MDPQNPGGYDQGPQQNYGYPNGQGNGQYDFFMGQGQPPKRSILPSGDSPADKLKRVIIFGVGLFVLIIGGLIFFNMLSSGDKNYPLKLTSLLQTQQELMRVAADGVETGRSTKARNKALNTELTVLTDQTELSTLVSKTYKLKINSQVLDRKKNTKTDKALADANANNRYDEVFMEILDQSITSYKAELQTLYNEAKTAKEKDVIQRSFDHMELLSQPPIQ